LAYFDLSKLNVAYVNVLKSFVRILTAMVSSNRHDELALNTTCVKNIKFMIIKIRTGCQYIGHFYYSEKLNWAAQNLRHGHMRPPGRGLDIAAVDRLDLDKIVENYVFVEKNTLRNRG